MNRAQVAKWLERFHMSKADREAIADAWPDVTDVREVHTYATRGAVEKVEAYGLELHLDGHGRAERVVFPDGAEVTG